MNAAGNESWTPLKSLNLSFLIVVIAKVIGLWLTNLLAFSLVDIASIGYRMVSPIQLPSADIKAIFTSSRNPYLKPMYLPGFNPFNFNKAYNYKLRLIKYLYIYLDHSSIITILGWSGSIKLPFFIIFMSFNTPLMLPLNSPN